MSSCHKIFFLLFFAMGAFCSKAQNEDTLIVGYQMSPPFVYEENGELAGISVWLWNEISSRDSIPYKLVPCKLGEALDRLSSHEIDLNMSPLTITGERYKTMDFSPPYYIASSTVMVRSASPLKKAWIFVASFFSLNFFRAMGALFLVIFVFGFFVWLFERNGNPDEFNPGLAGIWSGIWWSAVTMTTVGYGDKSPRTLGGRIIALIWMFAAIIIISGFTAGIASSLTVNQLSWSQDNISSFKEKPVGTTSNSATERWLRKNFFKNLKSVDSIEESVALLGQGQLEAVAYDEPYLRSIMQQDSLSQYEILPIEFNRQLYAMGFSETLDEEMKEKITIRLLEITESTDWKVVLSEFGLLKEN